MLFFRNSRKSKSNKASLRKKVLKLIRHKNDRSEDSSESGDGESQYIPSSEESESDIKEQEFNPKNIARITDYLVHEGLFNFAQSVSGGSKLEAAAMLWVKRTAQILIYTHYEIRKTSLITDDEHDNDIILR
jgi:hypothetical protein